MFVALFSILLLMESYSGITKTSKNTTIQLFGVCGFILILCSTLIFIFGVDFEANNNVVDDYSFRLRYGWLIESIIYLTVAIPLIAAGEYLVKKDGEEKTIIYPVVKPIVSLLLLSIILIYPYRLIQSASKLSLNSPHTTYTWILGVGILALNTLILAFTAKTSSRKLWEYEPPEVLKHIRGVGFVFLIGAVISFIWGINNLIYTVYNFNLVGIYISFFLIIGGIPLVVFHRKRKELIVKKRVNVKQGKNHILGYAVVVLFILFIVPSIFRIEIESIFVGALVGVLIWKATYEKNIGRRESMKIQLGLAAIIAIGYLYMGYNSYRLDKKIIGVVVGTIISYFIMSVTDKMTGQKPSPQKPKY